jgi:hypothetical protein
METNKLNLQQCSCWSFDAPTRFIPLVVPCWFLYATITSWPKISDVALLGLLTVLFFGGVIYITSSFTRIEDEQITDGCRVWLVGEFGLTSLRWDVIQSAKIVRSYRASGTITLRIRTKTGKKLSFYAPFGSKVADYFYNVESRFGKSPN